MHLCYIDESGTPEMPGNTSHYILAGIAIPVNYWKRCDDIICDFKKKWYISGAEIHTAWILRPLLEQVRIPGFDKMDYSQRRIEVSQYRKKELYRVQSTNKKMYAQLQKNYRNTESYVHLTLVERKKLVSDLSLIVGNWGFARLFAECIDKVFFNPNLAQLNIEEQAFEQLVSRFEQYLQLISSGMANKNMGLLIHDNNSTVAKRLTDMMMHFHHQGTLWTNITNIIETPLFVDSKLTGMVQIADLCSYSLRRYLENKEDTLFNNIYKRADQKNDKVVGVRHYTNKSCDCKICASRKVLP